MKKSITLLMAAVTAMAVSGCSSSGVDNQQLRDRYFVLNSVDGKPVTAREGIRPGIRFSPEMRVSGVMCNRFFGQGQLSGEQLHVPQLASTRMRCRDDQLNQWEQMLGRVLEAGVTLSLHQQTLTLSGSGHTLVYRAEQSSQDN